MSYKFKTDVNYELKENQELFYSKCIFYNILNNKPIEDVIVDFKNKEITVNGDNCFIYVPISEFHIHALGNYNKIFVKFMTSISVGSDAIVSGEDNIVINAGYSLTANVKSYTRINATSNANIICYGFCNINLENCANIRAYSGYNNITTGDYAIITSGERTSITTKNSSIINVADFSNVCVENDCNVISYPHTIVKAKENCIIVRTDTHESILVNNKIVKVNKWLNSGIKIL